jgi:hypothetical protein
MVTAHWSRRLVQALGAAALVVLLGSSYSYAADCTGPDDPDPLCTPVASPSPSVTPDPAPSVTPDPAPSISADPASVVLGADQFDALVWMGGALLMVSIVGVVGSWSR